MTPPRFRNVLLGFLTGACIMGALSEDGSFPKGIL
jgi:hypothetical protein